MNGEYSGTVGLLENGDNIDISFIESKNKYSYNTNNGKITYLGIGDFVSYTLTMGQTKVGNGALAMFTSNADLSKFSSVKIDGKVITQNDDYTTKSGSTIVILDSIYTNELSNGSHTIEIISNDGKASGNFEVANPISFTINGTEYKTSLGATFGDWIIMSGGAMTGNTVLWISPVTGLNQEQIEGNSAFQLGGAWNQYKNDVQGKVYLEIPSHGDGVLPTEPLVEEPNRTTYITIFDTIKDNAIYGSEEYLVDLYCCFDAGSQVLMADGTTKNIEEVKVGDEVKSYNEETKEFVDQVVEGTIIKHNSDDLVYVNLSDGTTIGMRAYHPLLTTEGYKSLRPELAQTTMEVGYKVNMLEVGDELVGYGKNVTVISIEQREDIENYDTYNLTIEGIHNYIVNGIVVHNATCPS